MHSIQRGTKAILACRHIPRSQFVQSVPTLRFSGRQMAGEFTTAKASLDKTTSDEEWTKVLSPEEFRVLRLKGTEPAGTGEYNKHSQEGTYNCAGCGTPLFSSEHKFDSGCGWPAFYDELPGAVQRDVDNSMGSTRTEVLCKKCGGHLGHVFAGEGFPTPTNERHCINSVSVKFEKK